MEQVIKLVKTYRVSAGLVERLRLAEEIFRITEPDLRLFVFSQVPAAGRRGRVAGSVEGHHHQPE